MQEERLGGNDNCGALPGPRLADPAEPDPPHFVKLRVRDYPDGTLAIFQGPRCLARYRVDGNPPDQVQPRAA